MVWNIFSFTHIPGEMIQFDEVYFSSMGWNHHLAHRFFLYQQVRQISEPGNHFMVVFHSNCLRWETKWNITWVVPHSQQLPPWKVSTTKTSDDAYCRHEHWQGKETPNKTQRCHLGKKALSSWLSLELFGRVAKDNITVSLGRCPWKKHQVELWLN